MRLIIKICCILNILVFLTGIVYSQSKAARELEQKVYSLNNKFEYEKSQAAIQEFLNNPAISDDDSYYGYLYLSYTYKRLFDYDATLQYLDKALSFGIKTEKRDFYISNINCQKALSLFDISRYDEADSLMQDLAKTGYKYLDDEYQSKIFMQEAYLLFLDKKYVAAEARYDLALEKMKRSSPCDLPMIYGKKIELYGAMGDLALLNDSYKRSLACADSCKIVKYTMYTMEMMMRAYEQRHNYREAYSYYKRYDSLRNAYNEKEHLEKITDLEKKEQIRKKEQEIILNKQTITSKNTAIALLITSLILITAGVVIYQLRQRQKQLKQDKLNAHIYTKQLLEETEADRKRVAGDLHDSISNELLGLKSIAKNDAGLLNSRIDTIINDIRIISRNLHPVLFDKVGLQNSIEQLVERVQLQNSFMLTADINYGNVLSKSAELQVYRIIQEAATNMIKYANAVAGKISIEQRNNMVTIEIKDNGRGFNVTQVLNSSNAFGLHNIIERSRAIGGEAKLSSGADGTVIYIEIPINS